MGGFSFLSGDEGGGGRGRLGGKGEEWGDGPVGFGLWVGFGLGFQGALDHCEELVGGWWLFG